MEKKYIAYLRKSPGGNKKNLETGLSIESQRQTTSQYSPIKEYVEIESGRNNQRPQLKQAILECKVGGFVLVVAKVDRLGRDAAYLLGLIDSSGVDFIFCDNPSANKLTVSIMAVIAEDEALRISTRTKAAMEQKKIQIKENGGFYNKSGIWRERLGGNTTPPRNNRMQDMALENENNVRAKAIISSIDGTLKFKSEYLNNNGFRTSRGGLFSPTQISRLS